MTNYSAGRKGLAASREPRAASREPRAAHHKDFIEQYREGKTTQPITLPLEQKRSTLAHWCEHRHSRWLDSALGTENNRKAWRIRRTHLVKPSGSSLLA